LRREIRKVGAKREAELDLALNMGMRRGEQYRLRWQDVDLKREVVTIPRSKHGEARHIQINSTARAALLNFRGGVDRIGYVVPSYDGPRTRD
jgi:integrase